nr:Peptidase family M1 [uncultured organism]
MKLRNTLLLLSLSTALYAQQSIKPVAVKPGVSFELATYRHLVISNIQYGLDFDIPAEKGKSINGLETISFNLSAVNQPLQLDFKQTADYVKSIRVNGKPATVTLIDEHLVIEAQYLKKGANKIDLQFTAGDASLNRNDDYLYALFVPDRARTVFPCFDQPDLKAHFLLTLRVPSDWKVLANGAKKDSVSIGQQTIYHFANSDKLSTYLFSFTAGKYSYTQRLVGSRIAEFLHRETDTTKIRLSTDSVFTAHQNAISFLEQWTGIPFPFQKVGFVSIPDFQFGGMEHPGEVQYKASSLFLDEGATKDQYISRANLISHETAHMWFGDMVTMAWFNDVWMKEVFANFMADKVTEEMMGSETFNLKFLQDHYPAAYGVDRTQGANPIRQQLDNLQEAGSMYGNIIYHKAPIMMRQLETLMGKEGFRQGIQEYLKKYAYTNATWNDLIGILSKHTKSDLYNWNKVWVNQPGRPVFDYAIAYNGGKISRLTLTQHPEFGVKRIWPQAFSITMVYSNHSKTIPVNMNASTVELKSAVGLSKPLYIVFNSNGTGYGLFPTDKNITAGLFNIKSPLQRAATYIAAYENMLSARYFKPAELLTLFESGLVTEKDEMNLRLLTGYISNIYWNFMLPATRQNTSAALEQSLWAAMQQQTIANNRKILFKAYQDVYLTSAAKSSMYTIWQQQQAPAGVKLTEDDYTSLALSIALKSDTATLVLQQQQERIKNSDRKKRLEFLMPALSLNQQVRDDFFNSLQQRSNRAKEAWVGSALGYLHHPLRQRTSIKYLPKSLMLLEEIQKTGDIFFPQSWLGATFGSYQSAEAAQVVKEFLNSHPDYNPKLKDKILQTTDNLFRAQRLLNAQ